MFFVFSVSLGLLFSAPVKAQASANTLNTTVPFMDTFLVPCANGGAGELVDLSGDLHVLFHTTVNGNNGRLYQHFQPQGVSGVGETTGDTYHAVGITQLSVNFKAGSDFVTTFVNNFRLIGQGPGNNFQVHENFHITVNANGDITAFHDNATFDCK